MAGQPLKKAVQVTELEAKIAEVCEFFRECMPEHYNGRTPQELSRDPVGTAWKSAERAIDNADDFVGDLGMMLREKAGITVEEAKARTTEPEEASTEAETVPTSG